MLRVPGSASSLSDFDVPETERLGRPNSPVAEEEAARAVSRMISQSSGHQNDGDHRHFETSETVPHHRARPAWRSFVREVNEVHQNALRAATLVGQLLAFSRKQTMQPRVLALRDVIGELALMLRRLLREGVELKLEHGNDLWPVHADETQISNALINLVVQRA